MSTTVTFHDAICDFLEKKVASRYNLKTVDINGNESNRPPQIVRSGLLLPKSISSIGNGDGNFPFIMPRFFKAENIRNERQSIVTLDVFYGVYGPGVYDDDTGQLMNDGTGYRDLWNLIESTRQAIFSTMTIDRKYRVMEDFFEAGMIQEDIYPYWEGYCRTRWHIVYPRPPLEEHLF